MTTIKEAHALKEVLETHLREKVAKWPDRAENWHEEHWIELHNRLFRGGIWLPCDVVEMIVETINSILVAGESCTSADGLEGEK